MGVLDILAAVVKDHEAKKAYGTPFYQQELAKLAQQEQGRGIANQQAQFNLDESQSNAAEDAPLRPLLQQAKIDELTGKSTKAKADAELSTKKAAGYDEAQKAINDLASARALAAGSKSETDKIVAQAAVTRAEAALHKALNPSAPKPSYQIMQDDQGNMVRVDKNTGTSSAISAPGETAAPPAPGAAPSAAPAPGPLRGKPSAQTANRRDQATTVLGEGSPLLAEIDRLKSQIGPGAGNANILADKFGMANPEARALRTKLGIVADLLPILHGFRGGQGMANNFKSMVGDINQGPEQLKASLNAVLGVAKLIQSGASQQEVEAAIASGGGGQSGGAQKWIRDPTTGKLRPQ